MQFYISEFREAKIIEEFKGRVKSYSSLKILLTMFA
jgi:hypothetical protein